jgi:hypothetical protein
MGRVRSRAPDTGGGPTGAYTGGGPGGADTEVGQREMPAGYVQAFGGDGWLDVNQPCLGRGCSPQPRVQPGCVHSEAAKGEREGKQEHGECGYEGEEGHGDGEESGAGQPVRRGERGGERLPESENSVLGVG